MITIATVETCVETWKGVSDRNRFRQGYSSPVAFRDPDSFETDRLELGRDAAQSFALETLHPAYAVRRLLGISEEDE